MRRAFRLVPRSPGRGIHTLFQTPPATAPFERATPVLFLPDAFHTPDGFASFLEPRFRTRGFSTCLASLPHDPDKSVWDHVDALDRVTRTLGTPPIIIAHGVGGLVAEKFLESWAAAALVLLNPIPPSAGATVARWLGFASVAEASEASVEEYADRIRARDADLRARMRATSSSRPSASSSVWTPPDPKLLRELVQSPLNLEPAPVPVWCALNPHTGLLTTEELEATPKFHQLADEDVFRFGDAASAPSHDFFAESPADDAPWLLAMEDWIDARF